MSCRPIFLPSKTRSRAGPQSTDLPHRLPLSARYKRLHPQPVGSVSTSLQPSSLLARTRADTACRHCCCCPDNAAAAVAGRAGGLQHGGQHHRLVRGRNTTLHFRLRSPARPGHSHDRLTSCRDLGTGTQLAQYKTNSSGRNRLCALGHDYFVAAQNAKDAVHFWTWHKVRRAAMLRAVAAVAGWLAGSILHHMARLRSCVLLTQSTQHWEPLLDHNCCIWHACPPNLLGDASY